MLLPSCALSCYLDPGGTVVSAMLAVFKRVVGERCCNSSYPLQSSVRPFSLYLIPGNLSRDVGQSAVLLLICKCVFHRQPLCAETVDLTLPSCSLEREGIDSPGNEGHFGTVFCSACGRGLDSSAPC